MPHNLQQRNCKIRKTNSYLVSKSPRESISEFIEHAHAHIHAFAFGSILHLLPYLNGCTMTLGTQGLSFECFRYLSSTIRRVYHPFKCFLVSYFFPFLCFSVLCTLYSNVFATFHISKSHLIAMSDKLSMVLSLSDTIILWCKCPMFQFRSVFLHIVKSTTHWVQIYKEISHCEGNATMCSMYT